MLTKPEKTQLKQLMSSPQWGALESLAAKLREKLRDEFGVQGDQWDTLKQTLLIEGQIRGINRLMQEAFQHANESGGA